MYIYIYIYNRERERLIEVCVYIYIYIYMGGRPRHAGGAGPTPIAWGGRMPGFARRTLAFETHLDPVREVSLGKVPAGGPRRPPPRGRGARAPNSSRTAWASRQLWTSVRREPLFTRARSRREPPHERACACSSACARARVCVCVYIFV